MKQEEINRALDNALEEAIFNEDIDSFSSVEDIKAVLTCMVQITEEQWQKYAVYCLQMSVERSIREYKGESIQ